MPGQPDLEAGVTASTGLFYARDLSRGCTRINADEGQQRNTNLRSPAFICG